MANAPHFSAETSPESDDDRSSSLSDLDEGLDPETVPGPVRKKMAVTDGDSEAETERLETSPNKAGKEEQVMVEFAPLGQTLPESSDVISAIHRQLETERFSDSVISSPESSNEELLSDADSDHIAGARNRALDGPRTSQASAGQKRKRTSHDNGSDIDGEQDARSRRKRTGSIRSEAERDPSTSDDDASSNTDLSRAGSQEPMDVNGDPDDDAAVSDEIVLAGTDDRPAESKIGKTTASKTRKSLQEDPDEGIVGQEEEDQGEGPEESDEEDLVEADEVEDAEAIARSEEERKEVTFFLEVSKLTRSVEAKRSAAMEALLDLEKRFATLRDR
jgi:hypothetical protein